MTTPSDIERLRFYVDCQTTSPPGTASNLKTANTAADQLMAFVASDKAVEVVAQVIAEWKTEPGEPTPPFRWKNHVHVAEDVIALLARRALGEDDG